MSPARHGLSRCYLLPRLGSRRRRKSKGTGVPRGPEPSAVDARHSGSFLTGEAEAGGAEQSEWQASKTTTQGSPMSITEYTPGDPFPGVAGRTVEESEPAWPAPQRAPEGAPNVSARRARRCGLWTAFLLRRTGRDAEHRPCRGKRVCGTRTCTRRRCARRRRSCILTGRNHHSIGSPASWRLATGFPGYDGRMPFENGLLPEMLIDSWLQHVLRGQVAPVAVRGQTPRPDRSTAGRSGEDSSATTDSSAARPISGIPT